MAASQKTFRLATVVVSPTLLDAAAMSYFDLWAEYLASREDLPGNPSFAAATGFRATIDTRIHPTATAVVEHAVATPSSFEVFSPYPNPFNPQVAVQYEIGRPGEVALSVYNVAGQVVKRVAVQHLQPGPYTFVWDGRDDSGVELASGTYFVRAALGEQFRTRKVLLLR